MIPQLLKILRESIKAVPAMKYALAVTGLLAVVGLVGALKVSPQRAVFGAVITLVLMVAMVIFARLTTTAPRHFFLPVQIMMWAFLVVTVATALLLFTSTFFQWPRGLGELVNTKTSSPPPRTDIKEARDMITAAQRQRQGRDYEGAWSTIGRALAAAPESKEARNEQLQVAMAWVREVHASDASKMAEIVRPLSEVLHLALTTATGGLAADIHAHIGHANFLQDRQNVRKLRIEAEYAEAVALDPTNPFAHAMWGHWLMWERPPQLAEARKHFRLALTTGRESEYVYDMWVAGLLNNSSLPAAMVEALQLADEIRRNNGSLNDLSRRRIVTYAYSWLGRDDEPAVLAAVPPADHLATFQWLTRGRTISDNAELTYFLARLTESSGDPSGAARIYKSLLALDTTLADRAKQGLTRCEQQMAREKSKDGR